MEDEWFNLDSITISANRKKFLYESLLNFNKNFRIKYGVDILIFHGNSSKIINSITENLDNEFKWLLCDYCPEPDKRHTINKIKENLVNLEINLKVIPAVNTILDVEKVIQSNNFSNPKSSKDIEKIFAEKYEHSPHGYIIGDSLLPPSNLNIDKKKMEVLIHESTISEFYISEDILKNKLMELESKSKITDSYFVGGEDEALERFERKISQSPNFVNSFSKPSTISTNKDDNPLEPTTTGLSPYLSNGCISARMLWNECLKINFNSTHTLPPESLHGQLMFREMFYLLSRSVVNWDNDIENSNCKPIQWGEYDELKIKAWESGLTGFPYIDAMMRQLDATGWMHHLGRHAVSCFFTRGQLWQNWKYGRNVFEKKLIDSDWALNNGNWLWLAGVAPFSMPYYRIYNPCPDSKSSLNVETTNANFIRHWIPELSHFPSKYIFEPHLAPSTIQHDSKCVIGKDYPFPIVDRKQTRKRNLSLFKESNKQLSN
jgi:cryptochrome